MPYCAECGVDHHAGERERDQAADREVEIARINAHRDIEVAKVGAKLTAAVAETENAITTAHAEGRAEGLETVLEAGGGQGDELGDGAPIVVTAADPEPVIEPEPEPEMAPPVVETTTTRSKGGGWWSGYN